MTTSPTIVVTGSAERQVDPDYARLVVAFQVSTEHDDDATVVAQAAEHADDFRDALARAVLPVRSVSVSGGWALRDRHRQRGGLFGSDTWVDAGWVGGASVTLETRPDLIGQVVDIAAGHAGHLREITWCLDADNAVYPEVRSAAVREARRAAADLAAALERPLGELVLLSEPDFTPAAPRTTTIDDAAGPRDLLPRPLQASTRVEATFTLGPPTLVTATG